MKRRSDSGIALVAAILMLGLMSALLVGVTAMAVSEQRSRFQDKDRTLAFEAAHGGLEKLTNDLGDLFNRTYAPTTEQIATLREDVPELSGAKFSLKGSSDEHSGYTITKGVEEKDRKLTSGLYEGLYANITPYSAQVTARTSTGAEATVERTVNTVAIPVFQFGIFSETDLSFFPGPDFNFGGRVHTNGNLFLAKASSNVRLVLGDRVTAVKEIVRKRLSNGHATSNNYDNEVRVLTEPGGCSTAAKITSATCRVMLNSEGSVEDGENSTKKIEAWRKTSVTDYHEMMLNGRTGAKRLNLPLATQNAKPIDLIRRPPANEHTTEPAIFGQRYYQYASVRILLSNTANDISKLPQATAPKQLSTLSTGTSGLSTNADEGFLLIQMQSGPGAGGATTWTDVTDEVLGKGFRGRSQDPANCQGAGVLVPDAGAIIRLSRLKNGSVTCNSKVKADHWPNTLYDPREGRIRDEGIADGIRYGGIMYYVELDIANLRTWLKTKGTGVMQETGGYVVYFSDRRGNRNLANEETGELGFEDVVNPTSVAGDAGYDGEPEAGEDVNGNNVLDTYGKSSGSVLFKNSVANATTAQSARASLFRRALKLVNGNRAAMLGGASGTHTQGLTIASENPVYIQGDYNATSSEDNSGTPLVNESYDRPHIASAVIADAVTLLSNQWLDAVSFSAPNKPGTTRKAGGPAVYRTAIVAGKTLSFPKPSWAESNGNLRDFGTDGGTHNFLRYLEDWTSRDLWYRGSMVSFYTSRQAVGIYKCCVTVYGAPNRLYSWDEDFKESTKLPPRTPMVRDVNTTTFKKLSGPPETP